MKDLILDYSGKELFVDNSEFITEPVPVINKILNITGLFIKSQGLFEDTEGWITENGQSIKDKGFIIKNYEIKT